MLVEAGIPAIDENLLFKGLLSNNNKNLTMEKTLKDEQIKQEIPQTLFDLGQSENDFIDAYNALTRLSPLPKSTNNINEVKHEHNFSQTKTNDNTVKLEDKPKEFHKPKQTTSVPNLISSRKLQKSDSSSSSQSIQRKALKNNKNNNKEKASSLISAQKPSKVNSNKSNDNHNHKNNFQNIIKADEDKTKNLNDIVDNTQKIIQQMKNEINSDINSLDDRSLTTSESDNSSDGPDFSSEESVYSRSEKESDEETLNDNEISSEIPSQVPVESPEKKALGNNRTSSEDNEQFEEAMDHLDDESEEIKLSNMEKLDSIVRSLQEIHTLSVEVNLPDISEVKLTNLQKQDLNNNFPTVQTFEEIYNELNSNTHHVNLNINTKDVHQVQKIDNRKTYEKFKQEINFQFLENREVQYAAITQNDYKILNALLDYNNEIIEEVPLVETVQFVDNVVNNNDMILNTVEDVNISPAEQTINKDLIIEMTTSNNELSFSDDVDAIPNANIDNLPKNDNSDNSDTDNNIPAVTIIRIENSPLIQPIETESAEEKKDDTKNDIKTVSDDIQQTTVINKTNKTLTTKSNIPKLMKTTNTVQKTNKTAPKQIVSKVPVRRVSVKQYPAPSPPKTHFGNIQSGHVKQLQSRLLNKNTGIQNASHDNTSESTGTIKMKKQAPQPPTINSRKLSTPPRLSPPKKQYFRETCKTEDEWSDSEEDQPSRSMVKQEEIPVPSSSPPPPPTVRRVSGQLIDLTTINIPEGSPEVSII